MRVGITIGCGIDPVHPAIQAGTDGSDGFLAVLRAG
jgi:hypothetical protein